MKVFISGDIEGTCMATTWEETRRNEFNYDRQRAQMTAEVKAACEGAVAAGADYILVNDAHGSGLNIDPAQLPECAEVIRGWSGHYLSMADGVDESFDAAMFVGYHAAAGRNGNPLSHTETRRPSRVRINGRPCSEFVLYSWACALYGVPTVLLTGDKTLTEDSRDLHPGLHTVAVKDGFGGRTRNLHPHVACRRIRTEAEAALKQDLAKAKIALPEHFVFEVEFKEHPDAVRRSFYPGFRLSDDRTIVMETDDFTDVLRAVQFVL